MLADHNEPAGTHCQLDSVKLEGWALLCRQAPLFNQPLQLAPAPPLHHTAARLGLLFKRQEKLGSVQNS
jgi:hypothetical protein